MNDCDCIKNCCEGEHAGYCYECAGWGDSCDAEGVCGNCNGSGICPKCDGRLIGEGMTICRRCGAEHRDGVMNVCCM